MRPRCCCCCSQWIRYSCYSYAKSNKFNQYNAIRAILTPTHIRLVRTHLWHNPICMCWYFVDFFSFFFWFCVVFFCFFFYICLSLSQLTRYFNILRCVLLSNSVLYTRTHTQTVARSFVRWHVHMWVWTHSVQRFGIRRYFCCCLFVCFCFRCVFLVRIFCTSFQ